MGKALSDEQIIKDFKDNLNELDIFVNFYRENGFKIFVGGHLLDCSLQQLLVSFIKTGLRLENKFSSLFSFCIIIFIEV